MGRGTHTSKGWSLTGGKKSTTGGQPPNPPLRKRFWRTLVIFVFLTVFLYCSYTLISYYTDTYRASREFDALRDMVTESSSRFIPDDTPPSGAIPTQPPFSSSPVPLEIMPRFSELYERNNEFVGWVKINGTRIDYPVMQSAPEVPFFYLYMNFDRLYDINGIPFLDAYRSIAPNSDHMVIHGHNMRSGIMFHDLLLYNDEAFWDKHRYVLFDTLYAEGTYRIFAALIFDVSKMTEGSFRFDLPVDFRNETEFSDFINEVKGRSLYDTGFTPVYGDELLTLATCEYTSADGRFVLLAYRIG